MLEQLVRRPHAGEMELAPGTSWSRALAATTLLACALSFGCAAEGEAPAQIVYGEQVFDLASGFDDAEADGSHGLEFTGPALPAFMPQEDGRPPLRERSREELAEALRPAIMHPNGHMYVAHEPNWEAADLVLRGEGLSRAVDWQPRARGGDLSVVAQPIIIGADGRTRPPSTTAAPFNAIVRIALYANPDRTDYRGWCTGSYIGPWTVIMAAHCLVYSDGKRARTLVFEPARDGSLLPFGSFDCRNGDPSTTNDIYWAVPNGYAATGDNPLDYAVIDTYPCHTAPRRFAGYMVNAGSDTYSMYGYPQGTCPGAPSAFTYQCGMSGPAYPNEWRIETEHIDSEGGQSGAPWFHLYDTYRPVATHVGYREYFDFWRCGADLCRRNYGRRIDDAVDEFIRYISYDY